MIDAEAYDIVNHLMITLKYYIHICKCKQIMPSTVGLIEKIKDTERLEKMIAIRKQKLEKHQRKWDLYLQELDAINT